VDSNFADQEGQDKFPGAVRVTPQNIRTQIIAIESNWPYERKGKFNWTWPQIWRAPLAGALDPTDEIETFFFNLMDGNEGPKEPPFIHKHYWNRSGNPITLERDFRGTRFPHAEFESQQSTTMNLGFDHGKAYKDFREGTRS
jgi:hypothetical protein